MNKLIVGLTGGIGSGKTSVSDLFASKGIDVIDADIIARDVVAPGSAATSKISAYFGPQALLPDGHLDRAYLRQMVFSDPAHKTWIDSLLHPLIRQTMALQTSQSQSEYCILSIPLLIEGGPNPLVNRILVVDVDIETQLSRASARDGQTPEQVQRIIDAQASRAQRLAAADDVIDNTGSRQALLPQVDTLHKKYLQLAKNLAKG